MLYYIYTCSTMYTPLASSWNVARDTAEKASAPLDYQSRRAYLLACIRPNIKCPSCSPQALYRLLDQLDVCTELQERTLLHIISCYNVENVSCSSWCICPL